MNFLSMDAAAMVDVIQMVLDVATNWWVLSLGALLYTLFAVSLWQIAKRRGINKHWLALFPVGNLWVLGSIADHYRSLQGKTKNRRKVLRIIGVTALVLTAALIILAVCGTTDVISRAPSVKISNEQLQQMENMTADERSTLIMGLMIQSVSADPALVEYVRGCAVAGAVMLVCLLGVSLVGVVIGRIAAYDVLCSCDPGNAVFMTVLCCAFPPAMPMMIFLLHKKDMGLPVTQGKKKK